MTPFDLQFAAQAAPALFRRFGESIEYLPRDGRPRSITAIVIREPLQPLEPIDGGVAPVVVVKVLNDRYDTNWGGVSVDELDTGGDKVRLSWRKGEDPEDRYVARLVGVKGGMTVFEVR